MAGDVLKLCQLLLVFVCVCGLLIYLVCVCVCGHVLDPLIDQLCNIYSITLSFWVTIQLNLEFEYIITS